MKTNTVFEAINAINLEPIKTKVMHAASGEGWTRAKADAIALEYRRFLYLMHTFPNEQVAPTVDVDTFWHYHILDTMKYADDCEQTFGYFLHHYPYVGLDSEEHDGAQARGGNRMQELYEQTFGEAYIRAEAYGPAAARTDSAYCMLQPGVKAGGAAAYCMLQPGSKAGADAAYCMLQPGMKAGTDAAYCMLQPGMKSGMDAAYCMLQPGMKAGTDAAYCMLQPGLKARRTAGAEAAYCMLQPQVPRTGTQAAYCMLQPQIPAAGQRRAAPVIPA